MRKLSLLVVAAGLALLMLSAAAAPFQQQTIEVGGSVTVTVDDEGPAAAAPVILTISEPSVVTLLATSADETDPVIRFGDAYGREIITIDNNPSSEVAVKATDAAFDNTLLIAGQYVVLVGRSGLAGSGEITLSVLPGDAGAIGVGSIQVIEGELAPFERYQLDMNLEAGEVISVAAIGKEPEYDLRLNLRDPAGSVIARNDDNDTFDLFLSDLDPRLYRVTIGEAGVYTLQLRPFNDQETGTFALVIQRHGKLSGEPRTETLTGSSEVRARNTFYVDFEAGEIVRLTARALNDSLDPEIEVLTPDAIYIASNDDHGTEATDLGRFDARVERLTIEETGAYELNVNSVSGRGEFEVVIERFGVFSAADLPPIDTSAGQVIVVTPAPADSIPPEATAEPSS